MFWKVSKILSIGLICFAVHNSEAMVKTFRIDQKDTAVLVCALQQKNQQINQALVIWRHDPYNTQYSRKLLWLW